MFWRGGFIRRFRLRVARPIDIPGRDPVFSFWAARHETRPSGLLLRKTNPGCGAGGAAFIFGRPSSGCCTLRRLSQGVLTMREKTIHPSSSFSSQSSQRARTAACRTPRGPRTKPLKQPSILSDSGRRNLSANRIPAAQCGCSSIALMEAPGRLS